jgi:hypothetical protein
MRYMIVYGGATPSERRGARLVGGVRAAKDGVLHLPGKVNPVYAVWE